MTITTVVNARNKEHQVTTSRSFVANQTQAIFFVLKIWYKSQITETQKLKKLKKTPSHYPSNKYYELVETTKIGINKISKKTAKTDAFSQ